MNSVIFIGVCLALSLCRMTSAVPSPISQPASPAWARSLQALLPPFQLRPLPVPAAPGETLPGGGSLDIGDDSLSPDGRWIISEFDHPVRKDAAGGEEPRSLRLYDQAGRFVRDLTFPRFYYVTQYWWEPFRKTSRSELIFASTDFNTEGGFWRCDPQTGRMSRLSAAEAALYGGGAHQVFTQWSPTGNSYLVSAIKSPDFPQDILVHPEITDYLLYGVQTQTGKRHLLTTADGYNAYSPDGRRVLFSKNVLNLSRQIPSDEPLSGDELWTIRPDGTRAFPVISWAQEQRMAAIHQWRNLPLTGPVGWCGAATMLANGSFQTGNLIHGGLWIVQPGGRVNFVPGPWLLAASQDGRAFELQDKAELYLMTLRARPMKHTSSMRRPATVALKYRISPINLPAGTPVPDVLETPIRPKPFYARLRRLTARLHIPATISFTENDVDTHAPVRNVADVSIYDVNMRGQAVGSVLYSPFNGGSDMQTAILWQHGKTTWLPGLGEIEETATSINDRGQIVGKSWGSSDGKTWLWEHGCIYDLQKCLESAPGWTLSGALSINNQDQIVCVGTFHGKPAECLLQPSVSTQSRG